MKQQIEQLVKAALEKLRTNGDIADLPASIQIDTTKDKTHGDYASNIALVLAKSANKKPRDLAASVVQALPASPFVKKVEIAGPGFINFFLAPEGLFAIVPRILSEKTNFGHCKMGREKRVLVEFVSSNPTGPLHVGHGRHAAYGSVLCRLLDAVGFKTHREYYVNDAGRQMDILTVSIWLRYLILCGEVIPFPANAYKGEYVTAVAAELKDKVGTSLLRTRDILLDALPLDEPDGGDKELYIDALVARSRELLGEHYQEVFELGLAGILADISSDLVDFGVAFDHWFSERELVNTAVVDHLLDKLRASGHLYERDGALWFRATDFDDVKDRVLVGQCHRPP